MTEPALQPYSKLRDPNTRRPLGQLLPLPHPWSMYLEPTNVCNFKCKWCPESFPDYEEQVGGFTGMDLGLYEKIIAEVRALGRLKVLRFYSVGEPLLNKNLGRMIRHAFDQGVAERTELTTNATALNETRAKELIDSGLTYLRVSVYAMTDERHVRVTGSKVPVARILENVRRFRRLRDERGVKFPALYVKMIDSLDPEENAAFLSTFGPVADEVVLEKPMNWSDYENRDLIGSACEKEVDRERLFPHRKEVCPFPFYTLVVTANGDVTVCCVDWNKKTAVGNLREQSLAEIWNGPELRAFRRMHLENRRHENPACRNCTYLYTTPDNLDGLPPQRVAEILGSETGLRRRPLPLLQETLLG
jgi:radical SAM protein with 4Fe4S-binding SPASM domain